MEQGIIELFELLKALLLMVEHLDNLLSFHHLLNIAVLLAEVGLLRKEILAALGHQGLGNHHYRKYHRERHKRERYADGKHADQHRNNRNGAVENLRHTLADHLTQGIDVVGVDAHDSSSRRRADGCQSI